jgi:hypothetical protein
MLLQKKKLTKRAEIRFFWNLPDLADFDLGASGTMAFGQRRAGTLQRQPI